MGGAVEYRDLFTSPYPFPPLYDDDPLAWALCVAVESLRGASRGSVLSITASSWRIAPGGAGAVFLFPPDEYRLVSTARVLEEALQLRCHADETRRRLSDVLAVAIRAGGISAPRSWRTTLPNAKIEHDPKRWAIAVMANSVFRFRGLAPGGIRGHHLANWTYEDGGVVFLIKDEYVARHGGERPTEYTPGDYSSGRAWVSVPELRQFFETHRCSDFPLDCLDVALAGEWPWETAKKPSVEDAREFFVDPCAVFESVTDEIVFE